MLKLEDVRPHKVVDCLAALLVGEAGLVVSSHHTLPSPLPNLATKICLPALTHFAFPAEGLQHEKAHLTIIPRRFACLL